jgi:hypothetical protein
MKDFRFEQYLIANVDSVLVDIGYIVGVQKMCAWAHMHKHIWSKNVQEINH